MFEDRSDAGRHLGEALATADLHDPVVLALPRGGVPVAWEVARRLDAPLEALIARKVGAPGHPELGLGAISEGGVEVWDEPRIAALGLTMEDLRPILEAEQEELRRRVQRYRGGRPLPDLRGRTAVVVDDGLATGVTATAAVRAAARAGAARVVLAVPVGARQSVTRLSTEADVVCLYVPPVFQAVGRWYRDFRQTDDETVERLLADRRKGTTGR